MPVGQPVQVVQDLHKSYGETQAVLGVSFEVTRGEVFGLLGPNGAGKTTIISMITGLLEPTSGRITVDGLDLKTDTIDFIVYKTRAVLDGLTDSLARSRQARTAANSSLRSRGLVK